MTDSLIKRLSDEWAALDPVDPLRGLIRDAIAALSEARAAIERQSVPASQDAANLLARYERQWHRMGELWERHQGKGWPDKESAEFQTLRDKSAPATRAALLAMLAAAPQPQPVQEPLATAIHQVWVDGGWLDKAESELWKYPKEDGWDTRTVYTTPQAQPQPVQEQCLWARNGNSKCPVPQAHQPLTRAQFAEAWMSTEHITHATERQIAYGKAVEALVTKGTT